MVTKCPQWWSWTFLCRFSAQWAAPHCILLRPLLVIILSINLEESAYTFFRRAFPIHPVHQQKYFVRKRKQYPGFYSSFHEASIVVLSRLSVHIAEVRSSSLKTQLAIQLQSTPSLPLHLLSYLLAIEYCTSSRAVFFAIPAHLGSCSTWWTNYIKSRLLFPTLIFKDEDCAEAQTWISNIRWYYVGSFHIFPKETPNEMATGFSTSAFHGPKTTNLHLDIPVKSAPLLRFLLPRIFSWRFWLCKGTSFSTLQMFNIFNHWKTLSAGSTYSNPVQNGWHVLPLRHSGAERYHCRKSPWHFSSPLFHTDSFFYGLARRSQQQTQSLVQHNGSFFTVCTGRWQMPWVQERDQWRRKEPIRRGPISMNLFIFLTFTAQLHLTSKSTIGISPFHISDSLNQFEKFSSIACTPEFFIVLSVLSINLWMCPTKDFPFLAGFQSTSHYNFQNTWLLFFISCTYPRTA